jgi:hypothetical protein
MVEGAFDRSRRFGFMIADAPVAQWELTGWPPRWR